MGTDIDNEQFDERDYSRFAGRLGECLAALGQSLDRPGFGTGPATIGAGRQEPVRAHPARETDRPADLGTR